MTKPLYRSVLLSVEADAAELERNKAACPDALCIDLEDTVEDKAAARTFAAAFLASDYPGRKGVRINPLTTPEGLEDLLWLRGLSCAPDVIVMTKIMAPYELTLLEQIVPQGDVIALIETPQSVETAAQMQAASSRLCMLMFGGKDLSYSMGATRSWDALAWPRGRVVTAAKASGVHAVDENFRPLDDLAALEETSLRSKAMGYQGRLTISAAHVAVIHKIYS